MITDDNPALQNPDVRRVFEEEVLVGEATDTVIGLLESLGLPRKELARRLGVSRGRVSQILSGEENLTLRSLGALGWALGMRFQLTPTPMADRRGTPATDDPPVPQWLSRMPAQPGTLYAKIPLQQRSPRLAERTPLRVIRGELSSAA